MGLEGNINSKDSSIWRVCVCGGAFLVQAGRRRSRFLPRCYISSSVFPFVSRTNQRTKKMERIAHTV
jgi:hypothetical protein